MSWVKLLCAVVTRSFFILIAFIGVWRVTRVKNNYLYWFLTFLFLPLVVETIVTFKIRRGEDYKWFSPAILLFLVSIIPSIWILEIHHQQNKSMDPQCKIMDSWKTLKSMISKNTTGSQILWGLNELQYSVCSNDWILALHQILLILLIVGKWLLPIGGGVTRDELSQLLLIFVGTAADVLEFTNETLSDVKENSPKLVYVILSVWTWSMMQFPLHLSVVSSGAGESSESNSVLRRHSTDIWNILESLLFQDGPFLGVRLMVIIYHEVFHQMLVFFTIKNFLVIILNIYRLYIICKDSRPITANPV